MLKNFRLFMYNGTYMLYIFVYCTLGFFLVVIFCLHLGKEGITTHDCIRGVERGGGRLKSPRSIRYVVAPLSIRAFLA